MELCGILMILFELLAFVVVLWSWKICGARANLERRNESRKAQGSDLGRVYGGTRVLVEDGGYVSGLWEDWAVGMLIWCEKMVRERKSDRNNEFL